VSTPYLIRVDALLDDHWSERLGGHPLTRHPDGTTTIAAAVLDQAQLHGTLTAIRDIGADLLEVRIAPPLPD
jgi:hypothetical protein